MLPLNSLLIFSRTPKLFFLLSLIYFLLLSGLPVEAQAPSKKDLAETSIAAQKAFAKQLSKNPWSNIKGFRSAKFGMNEKSVYKAIAKDFKIAKNKVKKITNSKEKTTALELLIPELFSTGGTAKIGYIFGYKSKKLVQINVVWGSAEDRPGHRSIIDTANLLRTHFIKKRYKPEGLIANGKLSDSSTMVFRGKDQKNRMVLLLLNASSDTTLSTEEASKEVTLVLSYIENPEKPDIRQIVIGDDEF